MGQRTYAEERDRLLVALDDLAEFADRRESRAVTDAARALDKKLVENRFNVVVFGEFKRGKTTFVDALLGADVLPSAVVPLTSIVTAVTWGREIRARIGYLDGREEDVDVTDLATYVTERGNPDNALGVARAVVSYPSEDLRDGVFLVDTPGVGSVYQRNTEAARAFLSESDAAVFLTSADPPILRDGACVPRGVRGETARLFFVLNKIDYLSGLDRDESIAFTHRVIEEAVGQDVVVYPLSARRALRAKLAGDDRELEASGLPAFERDFRTFLLDEKGRAILASVAGRALRLVDDERNALEVQERALDLPVQELEEARRRMQEVFAQARSRQRDMHALLDQEAEALVSRLEQDLEQLRSEEETRLTSAVEEHVASLEDVRRIARDDEGFVFLREALRTDIGHWRGLEEQTLSAAFRDATARFVEEADGTERETVRLCGEILGIQLVSEGHLVELSSGPRSVSASSNLHRSSSRSCRTFAGSCRERRRGACSCATLRERLLRSSTSTWDAFTGTSCSGSTGVAVTLDRHWTGAWKRPSRASVRGFERSERDRQRSAEDALRAKEDARVDRRRLDQLREAFQTAATGPRHGGDGGAMTSAYPHLTPALRERRIEDVDVDWNRFVPRVRPVELLRIDWDHVAMSIRTAPDVPSAEAIHGGSSR